MRRTPAFAAAAIVAVTSSAAAAAGPNQTNSRATRSVIATYTAAMTLFTDNGSVHGSGVLVDGGDQGQHAFGFVMIPLRRSDRSVTVSLQDSTQRLVAAVVDQTTRSGRSVQLTTFCGRTTRPLRLLAGGGELVVRPAYTLCGSAPSVPTTGTVRAVFPS